MSEKFKMDPERFKKLLEELDSNSVNTLAEKNARYSTNGVLEMKKMIMRIRKGE